MAALLQDIRYGLRMLGRSPGFTAVIVITLALGIGANTALFSVVDAVLLKPLPYQQPGQLVAVKVDMPGANLSDLGMSQPELEDFQKNSGVFENISAVWPISANITGREKPERVEANAVSTNFFTLLGVKPALGRVFNAGDSRKDSPRAQSSATACGTRCSAAIPMRSEQRSASTPIYTPSSASCRRSFIILLARWGKTSRFGWLPDLQQIPSPSRQSAFSGLYLAPLLG